MDIIRNKLSDEKWFVIVSLRTVSPKNRTWANKKIKNYSGLFLPVTLKLELYSKCYIISFDNHEAIFVCPKKANVFWDELIKINPRVEVQ